jgi:endonuclease G
MNAGSQQLLLRTRIKLQRAAAISSLTCAATCWILSRDDNEHSVHYSSNDAAPSRGAQAPYATGSSFMSPILPIRILRPNPHLEIAFDVRTRNPIYVMEKLSKATLPTRGGRRKRPNFFEESTIAEEDYRSKLSHYKNSGYDRGHMAPAADFPDSNTADTFTLCNISPQDHVMNVSVWNLLEEWVRKLVRAQEKATTTVYVVTGPLWLPKRKVEDGKFEYQHIALGSPPSLVSVPTHFFKVVAVVDDGGANPTYAPPKVVQHACFVVSNHNKLHSKLLEDYVVSWKDLEAVTGLQFFPQWATREWKDRADHMMRDQVAITNRSPSAAGSNANPPFLLTDGSSTTSTNKRQGWSKTKMPPDYPDIVHLCADGRCR